MSAQVITLPVRVIRVERDGTVASERIALRASCSWCGAPNVMHRDEYGDPACACCRSEGAARAARESRSTDRNWRKLFRLADYR